MIYIKTNSEDFLFSPSFHWRPLFIYVWQISVVIHSDQRLLRSTSVSKKHNNPPKPADAILFRFDKTEQKHFSNFLKIHTHTQ